MNIGAKKKKKRKETQNKKPKTKPQHTKTIFWFKPSFCLASIWSYLGNPRYFNLKRQKGKECY